MRKPIYIKQNCVIRDYTDSMAMRIKLLSLEMSRVSPVDWNNFIEIVLSS